MSNEFIKPNWKQCNLNISATLAEFLGAPNTNETLPLLKAELKKITKILCLYVWMVLELIQSKSI